MRKAAVRSRAGPDSGLAGALLALPAWITPEACDYLELPPMEPDEPPPMDPEEPPGAVVPMEEPEDLPDDVEDPELPG